METLEETTYIVLIHKSKLFGQSLGLFLSDKFPLVSVLGVYQHGINAYKLIGVERIDLLVIDATLNNEPVSFVINRLKEAYPKLYVIVLADNDSDDIELLPDLGADKIISNQSQSSVFELLMTIAIRLD